MGILSTIGKSLGIFLIKDRPGQPNTTDGVGVTATIALPAPVADNGETPFADAVDALVASDLADPAVKAVISPHNGEHEMLSILALLQLFQAVGSIVGPLVSYADQVAPNSPGVHKLNAVVDSVKTVATAVSVTAPAVASEWDTTFKPAVTSLVSAFADLKHALEGNPAANPPAPAVAAVGAATPVAG